MADLVLTAKMEMLSAVSKAGELAVE